MSEPALHLQPQSEGIIQSARNGDQEALRKLYDATKNYAWFIAKRYLQNDSDVEDVLQEAYFNAFSKLDTFEEGAQFKPWLHRIVTNKCIDFMRRKKQVLVSQDEVGELAAESEEVLPGEWLEQAEKRNEIIKIIDALPHSQRMAITLFYLENFSISKIANAMGVTLGTVKYNLHHGRKKIKGAVMLEEKKGNKLYSLMPIPPLLTLYAAEAEAAVMSELASEAVWAGTIGSLTAGGILTAASSIGAAAKVGLVAKFAALSTGMKAVTVATAVAVAGTAIALPVYNITANTQPAYTEDFQVGMNEPEESIAFAPESGDIEPSDTELEESDPQDLAVAEPSEDAPAAPDLSLEPIASSGARQLVTEPSQAAEPPTEEPPFEETFFEELLVAAPPEPETESSTPEPPVTKTPVAEGPSAKEPSVAAPDPPEKEPVVTEPEPPDTEPPAASGKKYTIADYYDAEGGFSALGMALIERDSEKQLTVKAGDLLVVDGRQYTVLATSLTLSFYTQPSLDNAMEWWTDYLENWAASGKVVEE
ncbi:MAG: sigma-70 family RNA polymerase sigma factor [Clostridiales bacterium]|nr:sigma-70 family RNA polymerase sigma factor [Clostridiales bacterium]